MGKLGDTGCPQLAFEWKEANTSLDKTAKGYKTISISRFFNTSMLFSKKMSTLRAHFGETCVKNEVDLNLSYTEHYFSFTKNRPKHLISNRKVPWGLDFHD